jgi:hypothetical protein
MYIIHVCISHISHKIQTYFELFKKMIFNFNVFFELVNGFFLILFLGNINNSIILQLRGSFAKWTLFDTMIIQFF